MATTTTTPNPTQRLWCASCGAARGTTDQPFKPAPHRPRISNVGRLCPDTDTFTD